jgi:glycosyltransferase involved in cell wall biosynthesis
MKAHFFLLDGATNASSAHRVLQYLPYLRAAGIDPVVRGPVPEATYQRLVEHGRGRGSDKAAFYGLFLAHRLRDVMMAGRADVAVIQRDLFPFGPPLLERLLHRVQPRVVYDTDDATYLRPPFTPNSVFQRLRRFDKVIEVVAQARWVSVATAPIAGWARQFNANVSVVPMAVDLAAYDRAAARVRAREVGISGHVALSSSTVGNRASVSGPIVLGWAGTAGGLRYLETLAPVLRTLADRHDVVLRVISGGYASIRLPGVPLESQPWCAASALEDMAAFDIGLVPLENTGFEQAKFPFKLLQYLALGVPSVSARVGLAPTIVHDDENGLLAGSPEEWQFALERLIADAALRRRLAGAGRDTVAAAYTTERVAPLLIDGLSRATR